MIQVILEGLLAALIVSISVGPIFFVLLDISINKGFKHSLAYILGVFISDSIMISILNLGLFDILNHSEQIRTWLFRIGGLILLVAGLRKLYTTYTHVPIDKDTSDELHSVKNLSSTMILGFTVNTMTPTVFFYWVGMATFLSGREYGSLPDAKWYFFGTILFVVIFLDIFKALLASRLKRILNDKNISYLNYIISMILIGISIFLLIKGFAH